MRNIRHFAKESGFGLAIFVVLWIILAGTFSWHDLLIGIIAAMLAMTSSFTVNRHYPARFSPNLRDLLSAWRLPWYWLSGSWEIIAAAGRDVLGMQAAKSLFRIAPFDAGAQHNPRDTARRVLAVVYTTTSPNSIVLGVNTSDRRLLFHQIERSSILQMTRDLGAQA